MNIVLKIALGIVLAGLALLEIHRLTHAQPQQTFYQPDDRQLYAPGPDGKLHKAYVAVPWPPEDKDPKILVTAPSPTTPRDTHPMPSVR